MSLSRRDTLASLTLGPLVVMFAAQDQPQDAHGLPIPKSPEEDQRLPNGKSQRDEIIKQQHADSLKDADSLVAAAEELRDELKRAGNYVVPVNSVRKTEEIEKLAKRIRGRLKN
jgi:hypothetical protein